MAWWAWLPIAAAIITILGWLLPAPRTFVLRLFKKGKKTTLPACGDESSQPITLQIPRPSSGVGHVEVRLTIDYVDGLPQSPPKIRDPFLEARKLEKENKYSEAIKLYEACFQPEITLSQKVALHILIGNSFSSLSELEEAEGHYKEAAKSAKKDNNPEGLATALGNMGVMYRIKGELDKALEHYQQALKIHRDIGHRGGEANQLGNMGIVYQIKGQLDKALEHYQQALKIHRDIGNREGEVYQLGNMGVVYTAKGGLDKALEYYQQALRIARDIGYREGEANQLGNMGNVYATKGELDKALEHYQRALKIFEEIGAKPSAEKVKQNILKLSQTRAKA